MILPRADCPECGRDVAISLKGRLWRHDPHERDPELRSCPGSLTPVQPPDGTLMLFVDPYAPFGQGEDPEQTGLF
jgi:hypothetical protein